VNSRFDCRDGSWRVGRVFSMSMRGWTSITGGR
jgi:hypothetical protein